VHEHPDNSTVTFNLSTVYSLLGAPAPHNTYRRHHAQYDANSPRLIKKPIQKHRIPAETRATWAKTTISQLMLQKLIPLERIL
jgi:hypothetical protein